MGDEFPITDLAIDTLQAEGRRAFAEGKYNLAFATLQRTLLLTALKWFAEEGVRFGRPEAEFPATELVIGLSQAATLEVEDRGERASHKLEIAAMALRAVAETRAALEMPLGASPEDAADSLAALILLGSDLGRAEGLMSQIRLGLLDRLGELELDRERRRVGAEKTKALKASLRETALGEALRILGRNPTLNDEDLALKVRENLRIVRSLRTIVGWVRAWRRAGSLGTDRLRR